MAAMGTGRSLSSGRPKAGPSGPVWEAYETLTLGHAR